jgi:hypothetical protein
LRAGIHAKLTSSRGLRRAADVLCEPAAIDILAGIDGVSFEDAWPRRVMVELGSINAPVLSLVDLAANKRAAGRPKDLVDLAWIEQKLNAGE